MITQEYLKECFDYNFESGELTWRVRPLDHFEDRSRFETFCKRYSGTVAGSLFEVPSGVKYRRVMVFRRLYAVHRIIWFWVNGSFPDNCIDHIDGDGLNNRIDNLRDVTRQDNARNQKQHITNKSGFTGVYWCKRSGRWRPQIADGGRMVHLGHFKLKWDALCARKSAEFRLGYHASHGSVR